MQVKQVTRYITEDGVEFKTRKEALAYETRQWLREELRKLGLDHNATEIIVQNSITVKTIINKYYDSLRGTDQ